jgi:molybdopterin-guanine dinucleotide biosynthesis protein A
MAVFRGAPMIDTILQCFAAFPAMAVSARPGSGAAERARFLGYRVLFDAPCFPPGPLAGVLAGLVWAKTRGFDYLATAPCDAPLLPPNMFARLLAEIDSAPAAYATTAHAEHPLCAVWSVRLAPAIERELVGGAHPAVRRFLAAQNATSVRFNDADAFANANTQNALQAMKGMHEASH